MYSTRIRILHNGTIFHIGNHATFVKNSSPMTVMFKYRTRAKISRGLFMLFLLFDAANSRERLILTETLFHIF